MGTPEIRLVALDLDGTLVVDGHEITARVRDAIAAAQARGVKVTVATGRMFRSARRFAKALNVDVPIICYQGALVRNPRTGETLLCTALPVEPALAVLDFARAQGLHINAYLDDELYMEMLSPEGRFYAETSKVSIRLVDDLREVVKRGTTKLVVVADEDRVPAVVDTLEAQYGDCLTVTRSHPRFAETIRSGVNKGTGLRVVARSMGIPLEATMAIGDNFNDLDLVTTAGLGIAMGDGDPRVRAAADWVTGTYAEDGVAMAIEKFVLGPELRT